jgi:hypothetical protein
VLQITLLHNYFVLPAAQNLSIFLKRTIIIKHLQYLIMARSAKINNINHINK